MSKKTLYFDYNCGYYISVVTENGKVNEFNFEKINKACAVGNIYKGRVESVHRGMQAAFVDCGLERNCFLSLAADECLPDGKAYDCTQETKPEIKVEEGDEILVQIQKLPVGKKGAKVTARPSFVGKFLIYMPDSSFTGVSRKIADKELRNNLVYSAARIKSEDDGIVFRAAAPYAKREMLKGEFAYLKNLYGGVKKSFETAAKGDLLYTDAELPVRVMRDTLSTDIDGIVAGSARVKELLEKFINLYPLQNRKPVYLHDTGRDMLEELGIARQLLSVTSPRVDLDNGAYLIIERTEALTVVDVNTGKFTGDYNLEQTVYQTNIAAAREIARQVRLRNIGGIVVVDFIDMQNAAHNKALVEELERALKTDKSKCTVAAMSKFGLVEFTRKRSGNNPLARLTKPCKYCGAAGTALTEEYILLGMRAKLMGMRVDGVKRVRADMNADVFSQMLGWEELKNELRGLGIEIYAVPHKTYHENVIKYKTDLFDVPDDAVKI